MVYPMLTSPPMRGPLLSGALGSTASLTAIARRARDADPVVVLGPLWLGVTLAAELRVLMLVASDDHAAVKRARRRAHQGGPRVRGLGRRRRGAAAPALGRAR